MKSDYERRVEWENRVQQIKGGLVGGATVFLALVYGELNANPGRGQEITACANGYDGIVRVTDERVLRTLGDAAARNKINDLEAEHAKSDRATLPGELACSTELTNGNKVIVLLPSGLDALQRMNRPPDTLPAGLELNTRSSQ